MAKRAVIALGGNALGNTLPEQMIAVKGTSKIIVDLVEAGYEVVVTHGNGPQVGMINNAMAGLIERERESAKYAVVSMCGHEPGIHRLRFTKCIARRVTESGHHEFVGVHDGNAGSRRRVRPGL